MNIRPNYELVNYFEQIVRKDDNLLSEESGTSEDLATKADGGITVYLLFICRKLTRQSQIWPFHLLVRN